ncbi:MAG: C1 family peptidase [Candidatus Wallbacteria bacterium]|nr:C1 family peptidase [Candidatus Wallbacteria bacterium]
MKYYPQLVIACLFAASISIQAMSAGQVADREKIRAKEALFKNIVKTCIEEKATYTVSSEAMPDFENSEIPGVLFDKSRADRKVVAAPENAVMPARGRFDWTAKGVVTSIKDQTDKAGTCWAFAMCGVFESSMAIRTGKLYDISEQDLINCNPYMSGIDGGYTYAADWLAEKGVCSEADCPYTASMGNCCESLKRPFRAKPYVYVKNTVADIKYFLQQWGPLYTTVSADNQFQAYSGGVYNHETGAGNNHAVMIVGWDDTAGKGCWIIKNSYGTNWGTSGFMYIEYGKSGIGEDTTFIGY